MPRKPSNTERKQYGLRINMQIMTRLEHLAVDEKKFLNELVEEAIEDLLKKYKKKG